MRCPTEPFDKIFPIPSLDATSTSQAAPSGTWVSPKTHPGAEPRRAFCTIWRCRQIEAFLWEPYSRRLQRWRWHMSIMRMRYRMGVGSAQSRWLVVPRAVSEIVGVEGGMISLDGADGLQDAILWIHIIIQMVAFGIIFPVGMVLGVSYPHFPPFMSSPALRI